MVLLKEKTLKTNKKIQVQESILMKKDLILQAQNMVLENLEKEMEILKVFQDLDSMIQQLHFYEEDKEMGVQ